MIPVEPFDFDQDIILDGGVGFRSNFLNGSRFEVEGLYTKQDFSSRIGLDDGSFSNVTEGAITVRAIMVNFLKKISIGERFRIFGGGGIGFAEIEADITETFTFGPPFPFFDESSIIDVDVHAAYQILAGAEYDLSEKVALFVQYKYLALDNADFFFDRTDFSLNSVSRVVRVSF